MIGTEQEKSNLILNPGYLYHGERHHGANTDRDGKTVRNGTFLRRLDKFSLSNMHLRWLSVRFRFSYLPGLQRRFGSFNVANVLYSRSP